LICSLQVIFCYQEHDEIVLGNLGKYKDKQLKSIEVCVRESARARARVCVHACVCALFIYLSLASSPVLVSVSLSLSLSLSSSSALAGGVAQDEQGRSRPLF